MLRRHPQADSRLWVAPNKIAARGQAAQADDILKIRILGSGTSHGIPMIGCQCQVCRSDNPRNRRLRASALVSAGDRNLLIDTAVEMRLQALAAGLSRVDAVVFTHHHTDHVCGFDDLRRFCNLQKQLIPCYGNAETIERLKAMFPYVHTDTSKGFYDLPVVGLNVIDGPFSAAGLPITPVPLKHGWWPCYGYRIGDFAYCTDVSEVPAESMQMLRNLDVLVLGALRHREHATHMSLSQSLEVVAELRPRQTYFTHMAHDLEHEATNHTLPEGVQLAYDGLEFEVADPPAAPPR